MRADPAQSMVLSAGAGHKRQTAADALTPQGLNFPIFGYKWES
jgi:hypothetical protein